MHFGFEAHPLDGNGVDLSFEVLNDMVLEIADVDTALMILSLPTAPGFVEVLCTGVVSRGGPLTFSAPHGFYSLPPSPYFGASTVYNPSTSVTVNGGGTPNADQFYAVIMKSWVPADGSGSSTHRHVHATPSMYLAQGDYITFHMDQAGVPCDVEMQAVLAFNLLPAT
ncbi:MAG: hypothetical protein M0T80_03090 [Actinomycetota bacterium]|nr:hypothetical protein [Actinomycetota bacterium]